MVITPWNNMFVAENPLLIFGFKHFCFGYIIGGKCVCFCFFFSCGQQALL